MAEQEQSAIIESPLEFTRVLGFLTEEATKREPRILMVEHAHIKRISSTETA
ncbi:hypothetical protein [Coriobacterium glomerans]|uniref:hypothetical protein n=1 Tax=Coriobacterium glomerans TaxID=33871 RepID=UPI0012EA78CE|nr:hypothetical protein [Coriobacterium glomerans]